MKLAESCFIILNVSHMNFVKIFSIVHLSPKF